MNTPSAIHEAPLLQLTDSAVQQIASLQGTDPEAKGKHLRFYIENGGCSGYQYGMVFDEQRPKDWTADYQGVTVLVDELSANYLRGAVVDYVDSLTGGGFKISNPKARETCGCGKSFAA